VETVVRTPSLVTRDRRPCSFLSLRPASCSPILSRFLACLFSSLRLRIPCPWVNILLTAATSPTLRSRTLSICKARKGGFYRTKAQLKSREALICSSCPEVARYVYSPGHRGTQLLQMHVWSAKLVRHLTNQRRHTVSNDPPHDAVSIAKPWCFPPEGH